MARNFNFPIIKREEVAEGTMSFWFRKDDPSFAFKPGQYARFSLLPPREGVWRDFSIASAPDETELMITTRIGKGAFKKELKNAALGTQVLISEPMGSFTLHIDASRPAVLIAGGIGITPMRSIVANAAIQKLPTRLTLFYSNRTKAQAPFLSEFEAWQKKNGNLKFVPTLTEAAPEDWPYERGRIDVAMLKRHVQDLREPIYYVTGTPAMVSGMLSVLIKGGANGDNIRTEEFAGY